MISKKALASMVLLLLVACAGLVSAYIYAQQTSYLTQTILNKPYYYVDQISNIDSSPDKGTHSNFTDQQYGPDSSFDTMNEASVGEELIIEDFVDNNTSDIDSSADVGSHGNFSAQQYGPDSIYDTLQEEDAGGGSTSFGKTDIGSSSRGFTGYLEASRFQCQQTTTVTQISLYLTGGSAGCYARVAIYSDSFGSPSSLLAESSQQEIASNGWHTFTGFNVPVSASAYYWLAFQISTSNLNYHYDSGLTNQHAYKTYTYGSFPSSFGFASYAAEEQSIYATSLSVNYQLDLEIQFSGATSFLSTEELCIYTGTTGDENIQVEVWNSTTSAWDGIFSDLTANSWNNASVKNWLTSSTLTIRFRGGNEGGDTIQDQWQIDSTLLRVEGSGSDEDAVDNDTSDVDSSTDLGNLTDFSNMQTADSNYATLTESAPAAGITYVNSAEASSTSGTSAQVNKPAGTAEDDFMIALLGSTLSDTDGSTMFSAPSDWTLEHDYTQNAYSGQHVYIYWKVAGASEPSSYTWTWTNLCGWVAQIITFRGVNTGSPIHAEGAVNQESSNSPLSPSITTTEDNCMIWLYDMCDGGQIPISGGAPVGTSWIDQTEITTPGNGMGISTAYFVQSSAGATVNQDWTLDAIDENSGQQYALNPESSDSRLDQEVQWIDVPHFLPNEELAIYGGSIGAEDIAVEVWNGTDWENLFTDLSSGWNNASITEWLIASTFTIRFVDGTQTGDSNQDAWQVDVALIHIWNEDSSYELDLEVQWVNVDFSEANEELCIYAGGSGSNTFSLDATGGYVIIGSGSVDWGSSAGTISFWSKFDILSGRPWGQHGEMEIRFSSSNLILDWGATGSLTSATSFIADKWYFIAIAWDEIANTLRLYVGDEDNAPVVDAQSTSWFSAVSILGVAENNFMASRGGYGTLDGHGEELRYWNVERTLSALQSDYNEELTGSETNLRSYFKLNNDFDDIGPNNDDGSASGSYSFSSDVPFSGSTGESIRVDVWTGASWQNVFTNLAAGWNNITVSAYLDSSTFTARFKGSIETADATQDSWDVDATLLHVWT